MSVVIDVNLTIATSAPSTSAELAADISDESGTGVLVFNNTPTLITPVLGAATGTSLVLSSFLTAATLIGGTTTTSTITIKPTSGIGTTGADIIFAGGNNGATEFARILNAGRMGLGVTAPTAILHLKAGTTAASTAPLKFNSGALQTTAEAGAVEFLTDAYYGTITTAAARKTFAFLESPSFTTPTLGVASATSLATSAASPLLLTNGQLVTVALTSQTVGGATLTIPNLASVSDTFAMVTLAQTLANKTFTAPVLGVATGTSLSLGTTPVGLFSVDSNTAALGLAYLTQANASADSFDLILGKARGTVASPTIITTADELGTIQFRGCDAAGTYVVGAAIKAISSGTVASTRIPAQLEFWTGTDAAPTVLTKIMTLTNAGVIIVPNGTAAAPTLVGASGTTTGFYYNGTQVGLSLGGASDWLFTSSGVLHTGNIPLGWTPNAANASAADTAMSRINAGIVGIGTGANGSVAGTISLTTTIHNTANVATWTHGSSSELLTLSTIGLTTDTSANLLPANSIIEAVVARITTTIATSTSWKMGDATTPGRFTAANVTLTSGTTDVGLVHIDQAGAAGPRQTAAAKVRVTAVGIASGGVVRITVFYRTLVPPTS